MFCTKCGRPVADDDVVCTNCGKPTGVKPSFTPIQQPTPVAPAQPVQPAPVYQAPVYQPPVQPAPAPVVEVKPEPVVEHEPIVVPEPVVETIPEPVVVPEPVVEVKPVEPVPEVPSFAPPKYDIPEAPAPVEKPKKEGKKDYFAYIGIALSAFSCIVNTGNYVTNFIVAFILALAGVALSVITLIKTLKGDKANLIPAIIGLAIGAIMIIVAPTSFGITLSNNIIYG